MKATHKMKLYPESFEKIASGNKDFEIRLNDEKRQKVKAGDCIEFTNTGTNETITTNVISLKIFSNFDELWEAAKSKYPGKEKSDFTSSMYAYWTPAEEEKYGALLIGIQQVR